MSEVPRQTSAISRAELAQALQVALQGSGGVANPTREQAALLLAQLRKESGTKVVTNNNPGNISVFPHKYQGDWYRPIWFDLDDVAKVQNDAKRARYERVHQRMLDKKAPSAFKSWPTIAAGMSDHIRTLKRSYPGILSGAANGSAREVAEAIFNSGYCRDTACQPDNNTPGLITISDNILAAGLFSSLPSRGTSPAAPVTDPLDPKSAVARYALPITVILLGLTLFAAYQDKQGSP